MSNEDIYRKYLRNEISMEEMNERREKEPRKESYEPIRTVSLSRAKKLTDSEKLYEAVKRKVAEDIDDAVRGYDD